MEPHPDENILLECRPSWRSILGFYVTGFVVAVLAGVVAKLADSTGLGITVFIGVMGVVVLIGLIRRIGTKYVISDQRLHIRHGIIARRVNETRLDRVQNVNTDQSMLERALRIGTVDFDTAGTENSDFAFVGVADPQRVAQAVDRAIKQSPPAQ